MGTFGLFATLILIISTIPLAISIGEASYSVVGPFMIRTTIAFVLMVALFKAISRTLPCHRASLLIYLVAGSFGTVSTYLVYLACTMMTSGQVAILLSASPLVTALFAKIWLSENIGLIGWSALFFTTAGIWIIFGIQDPWGYGAILIVFSLLSHSFSTIWLRKYAKEALPGDVLLGSLCVTLILLYVITIIITPSETMMMWKDMNATTFFSTVYLAVFGTLCAGFIYFTLLKRLSAPAMCTPSVIASVISVFLGWLFNGEHVGANTIMGASMVFVGMLAFAFRQTLERR